ncbi:MAG: hypothetical protein ACRD1T_05765 [Acidimicrobiia bacterium]
MNRRFLGSVVTVALMVWGVIWSGAMSGASSAPSSTSPLYWNADQMDEETKVYSAGSEVEGSVAKVWQTEEGIRFRIQTRYLRQGHAYTVWVFAFNHPENCSDYPDDEDNDGFYCDREEDLFNPAVFGSLMWGAGRYTPETGNTVHGFDPSTIIFEGERVRNSPPCVYPDWQTGLRPDCHGVLIGPGLVNPGGAVQDPQAEIHFVLRDHGKDQNNVESETTTINGGCRPGSGIPMWELGWGEPGNYACNDPQGN